MRLRLGLLLVGLAALTAAAATLLPIVLPGPHGDLGTIAAVLCVLGQLCCLSTDLVPAATALVANVYTPLSLAVFAVFLYRLARRRGRRQLARLAPFAVQLALLGVVTTVLAGRFQFATGWIAGLLLIGLSALTYAVQILALIPG